MVHAKWHISHFYNAMPLLVFLLGGLGMGVAATAGSAEPLSSPETLTPKAAASYVFRHWQHRTAPFLDTAWQQCNKTVAPVDAVLKQHKLFGQHHCLFRINYHAKEEHFSVEFGKQCYDPSLRDTLVARANMSAHVFTWIQRTRQVLKPVDFSFYYDATTATRVHKPMFIDLGRPVLTQSNAAQSFYTLPTADTHMLSGLSLAGGWATGMPSHLQGFAKEMSAIYHKNYTRHAWSTKQAKAVYAGSCFPTFNTMSRKSTPLLTPRADVCALYKASAVVDMSLSEGFPHNDDPWLKRFAERCKPCETGRRFSKNNMGAGYKYLINIDGYGAPTDGTFWKLGSSSVVMWLLSDKRNNEPLWQHWYHPLLQPYYNYISAHITDVEDVIRWCQAHDRECELIASRCFDLVKNVLTHETLLEYLVLLVTYLQDWSISKGC